MVVARLSDPCTCLLFRIIPRNLAFTLLKALKAIYKLVEDNDLVRNTVNDGSGYMFAMQGLRIVSALKKAKTIIDNSE